MELSEVSLEKKIKQHHQITSGRYDFTACQLDIMFMLLATIKDTDTSYMEYHISVKDIELLTKRKWNYQQLREATQGLMGRVYEIEMEQGLRQIVLFSEVQYLTGTGSFYIKINEPARQYIFNLKHYTLLELRSVLLCTSKHAKRLYAIACQRRNMKDAPMLISDLKEMLGLRDTKGIQKEQYSEVSMFQKKVLDIAKKQINEHTDISFDYQLHKIRSRSFTHITLFCGVGKTTNMQLQIDFNQNIDALRTSAKTIEKVNFIMSYGISQDVALNLAQTNNYKIFLEAKDIAIKDKLKGKIIEDNASYIVGVCKKLGAKIFTNTK